MASQPIMTSRADGLAFQQAMPTPRACNDTPNILLAGTVVVAADEMPMRINTTHAPLVWLDLLLLLSFSPLASPILFSLGIGACLSAEYCLSLVAVRSHTRLVPQAVTHQLSCQLSLARTILYTTLD